MQMFSIMKCWLYSRCTISVWNGFTSISEEPSHDTWTYSCTCPSAMHVYCVGSAADINVRDGIKCDCLYVYSCWCMVMLLVIILVTASFLVSLPSQISSSNASLSSCNRLNKSSTLENNLFKTQSSHCGLKFSDKSSITFLWNVL